MRASSLGLRVLCGVVVLYLAGGTAAGQGVDLRWSPRPGQSVRYELQQTSRNTRVDSPAAHPDPQRRPGTPAPPGTVAHTVQSTIDQTIILRFDVPVPDPDARADADGTAVRMTIERVRMTIESETVTLDVDTANEHDDGDPLVSAVRAMVGATLTLNVDEAGRITRSEGGGAALGLESLLSRIDPVASGSLRPDALGIVTRGEAPPAGARTGQRWTSTSTLAGALVGDVALTTTHRLKRVRAGVADVDIEGSMASTGGRDPGSDRHAGPYRVVSASSKGSYRWDLGSGWLKSLTVAQTVRSEGDIIGERRVMESTTRTRVERIGFVEETGLTPARFR